MKNNNWIGSGLWEGWSFENDRLVSPTGQSYAPTDVEPDKVNSADLMALIGCPSKQALSDRIKRGTVPQEDGRDGRERWWFRKNIQHLIKA